MPPLHPSSDPSILFNRHAVAVAKSQRLIASWLSPHTTTTTTADEAEKRKTAEREQEQEELDAIIFAPAPERLGVGAKVPSSDRDGDGGGDGHGHGNGEGEGLKKRQEMMKGNEKLKIQLLGRDYRKKMGKGKRIFGNGKNDASTSAVAIGADQKPRPERTRREEHQSESEDDEGGRSSLGKSKRGVGVLRKRHRLLEGLEDGVVEDEDEDGGVEGERVAAYGLEVRSGGKKRASGYLDEVLADRARRKRKKGRRRKEVVE